MARMKKEFNKDGAFQQRFRELYNEKFRTQQDLANALGASRPTVMGWLDGKSIPDIISLKQMTELFNVSADYLLGISDTERPDVNLRAAVEYTGLSEKAVEQIHDGLDEFVCDGVGASDGEKNRNRNMASSLIVSENFVRMLNGIRNAAAETYWKKIFEILDEQYCGDELEEDKDFHFKNDKDREVCKSALSLFSKLHILPGLYDFEDVELMTDNEVSDLVFWIPYRLEENSELHQFHAAKAFTGFIDSLIENKNPDAKKYIRDLENRINLNEERVEK